MQEAIKELIIIDEIVLDNKMNNDEFDKIERLISAIQRPVSDHEAIALVGLLAQSDDDLFGGRWALLHAIESAPNWPIWSALEGLHGEWTDRLRERLRNAGITEQRPISS